MYAFIRDLRIILETHSYIFQYILFSSLPQTYYIPPIFRTCGSVVKNLPASAGDADLTPGSGKSCGEGMATHSNILAWEIPRTEDYSPWGCKESDMT